MAFRSPHPKPKPFRPHHDEEGEALEFEALSQQGEVLPTSYVKCIACSGIGRGCAVCGGAGVMQAGGGSEAPTKTKMAEKPKREWHEMSDGELKRKFMNEFFGDEDSTPGPEPIAKPKPKPITLQTQRREIEDNFTAVLGGKLIVMTEEIAGQRTRTSTIYRIDLAHSTVTVAAGQPRVYRWTGSDTYGDFDIYLVPRKGE